MSVQNTLEQIPGSSRIIKSGPADHGQNSNGKSRLMGLNGTFRAIAAAERRQQRESQKRLRELERLAKEQAKLSAIEQARLEVETFDGQLEVLLSVHKLRSDIWDWGALAASLPPHSPRNNSYHEFKAKQFLPVLHPQEREGSNTLIEQAHTRDEQDFQEALRTYTEEHAEWEILKILAQRVLAGEQKAFMDALTQYCPITEITDTGSSIHFTIFNINLIECDLKVKASRAIPSEVKTLSASGKVSIKRMSQARFHEIHQDYVCGCMLRVSREVFAILPIDTLIITASTDILDARTGPILPQPVFSAVMSRAIVTDPDFGNLNPSDAMENLLHHGDFKASRKTGAFQPIIPLTDADLVQTSSEHMEVHDLLILAQKTREELKSKLAELIPDLIAPTIPAEMIS